MDMGVLGKVLLGYTQSFAFPAYSQAKGSAGESGCLWHSITSNILKTINLQTILYTNGRTLRSLDRCSGA